MSLLERWRHKKAEPKDPQVVVAERILAIQDVFIQFNNIFFWVNVTKEGDRGYKATWTGDGLTGFFTATLNEGNPELIDVYIKTRIFGREEQFQIDTKGEPPLTNIGRGWTYELLLKIATEVV